MSRWITWWRGLDGPARFRLYTRLALQGSIVAVVVVLAVASSSTSPWPTAGLLLAGVGAVVAVESQPDLATWPSARARRRMRYAASVLLAAVWGASVVLVHRTGDSGSLDAAQVCGNTTTYLALMSLAAFSRHPWSLLVALSVAVGIGLETTALDALRAAVLTAAIGSVVVVLMLSTRWSVRIVEELDHARALEAELRVTQERQRFSRDLHDVVGRAFSAIAVKSELAATLSRAGVTERATASMEEVKALAVQSMEEMRGLVRGYRDVDLRTEVAGARSLLEAAGCLLVVEGDPSSVPPGLQETAAWVVREGTTNIVKHSTATTATLALGPSGMSLSNTHPNGELRERSGLRGLAERLADVGSSLEVTTTPDSFTVDVFWETS